MEDTYGCSESEFNIMKGSNELASLRSATQLANTFVRYVRKNITTRVHISSCDMAFAVEIKGYITRDIGVLLDHLITTWKHVALMLR